ncbi:MAG: hypothetical protein ACI4QJ_00660 [Candidatus Spyradenecus sp.]
MTAPLACARLGTRPDLRHPAPVICARGERASLSSALSLLFSPVAIAVLRE